MKKSKFNTIKKIVIWVMLIAIVGSAVISGIMAAMSSF